MDAELMTTVTTSSHWSSDCKDPRKRHVWYSTRAVVASRTLARAFRQVNARAIGSSIEDYRRLFQVEFRNPTHGDTRLIMKQHSESFDEIRGEVDHEIGCARIMGQRGSFRAMQCIRSRTWQHHFAAFGSVGPLDQASLPPQKVSRKVLKPCADARRRFSSC